MTELGTITIIGAGLAGAKAAEALRKEGYEGRIELFGEEPQPPCRRPRRVIPDHGPTAGDGGVDARHVRADHGGGPRIVAIRLTSAAHAHGLALVLPQEVALARPTGAGDAFATPQSARHRPPRRRRSRPRRRVGEGGRPPAGPAAVDRQAPPDECEVEGGRDDDGATGVDPRVALAGT